MAFAHRRAASLSEDARPPPAHGADGRLANHHGTPFECLRNLLVLKTRSNLNDYRHHSIRQK